MIGSLVVAEAHGHHGLMGGLLYAIVFSLFAGWLLFARHGFRFLQIMGQPLTWVLLVLVLGAGAERHYLSTVPIVERISTAKALEYPARALFLHGKDLYSVTAGGTPISPGPGWIMLWAPLSIPNMTALIAVTALLTAFWMLRQRDAVWAGIFCMLMLVQPLFISEMRNGQDLFAISLMLTALAYMMETASEHRGYLILLAIFGGILATSRIPMIAMVSVLGVGLWRRNRRAGTTFLAIMLATALALHGTFMLWAHHNGDWYQPLHVLGRASRAGRAPRIVTYAIFPFSLWFAHQLLKRTASSWLLATFVLMVTLFAPVGIGEYLDSRHLDWEGANYIVFPAPLLLAVIVSRCMQTRQNDLPQVA